MEIIITTGISTITGIVIGFLINKVKCFNTKEKNEKTTFQALIRNAITSKYYPYKEIGEIPEYERSNITYLRDEYKKWEGNSYVEQIVDELLELPIKK